MSFLETTIALIILRCDDLLEKSGQGDSLLSFPALKTFVSKLRDEDLSLWAEEGEKGGSLQAERYRKVISLLGDSLVMQSLLDLMTALFVLPEFGAYLTHHFGYSVNLHLAFLLEEEGFPSEEDILAFMKLAERICHIDRRLSPLQYAELSLDERAVAYLFGSDEISPLLSGFTTRFDPKTDALHEPLLYEELIAEGAAFLEPGSRVLQLSGKGGRRFLSKSIAVRLGRPFLFLNIADFFREAGKERFEELKCTLIREAVFDEAGICFYGITELFLRGGRDENGRLERDLAVMERILFMPVKEAGIPLILCADTKKTLLLSPQAGSYLLLELPEETDYGKRKKLWAGFASLYGLSLDADRFAMRYRLNASEIASMLRGFLERRPDCTVIGPEEEAVFAKLCIQRVESDDGKNVGRVIYPDLKLDDVKVKPAIRAVLDDVVDSIRNSPVVLDSWGLRKNYPYGRSVSLLLSGPPGTGKTMTANAIAGELSLPLYQVNLSNIVDKYIGETEKNLEKAFLFAEKTDAVLFFDEADALFGARSEVHDAKDRYANTEISYLLQRIEAFDGIVVMATNIRSNMDAAFLRRIRYVVRYENPDEALRREIWESCLTEGLPHEEIDLDYLASQFDTFTGSIIKTVFLNACAYAAGQEEKLGMRHLIHAVRHELEKVSSVAFSGDSLGKYAYLS